MIEFRSAPFRTSLKCFPLIPQIHGDMQFVIFFIAGNMADDYLKPDSEHEIFPSFTVLIGPDTGKIFKIIKPLVTVGRGEDQDIRIDDRSVSRMHCEILSGIDRIVVRDLESRNGIKVNGKITLEQQLEDGDQLDVGSIRLLYNNPKKRKENK